jgi:glutaminyl-peptide cyclotransferase
MLSNRFKSAVLCAVLLTMGLLSGGACQEQAASGSGSRSPTPADSPKEAQIDAGRAYEDVKKMVDMGPRPAGSAALKKTQQYIETELGGTGLKVTEDRFDGDTPHGKIPMMNIIAELPGLKPDIVLVTGHYDTAPLPGFVGANDGASSAASVLEIARVLAKTKPEYTLWFVFFDGEEAVIDWEANNGLDNTYGSRHMAAALAGDGRIKLVRAMVLVDMIGDKDLDIRQDFNSTPWLTDLIWSTARNAGAGGHFLGNELDMSDDHLPFKHAGIPVVDIIDFNYGPDNAYWHTREDTLDKVSGESIKIVSDIVLAALPRIYAHLDSGA